jgi:hypothetical protein
MMASSLQFKILLLSPSYHIPVTETLRTVYLVGHLSSATAL